MNKRGNILDWPIILAMLLLTVICIFAAFLIINTVDVAGIFADNEDAQEAVNYTKSAILSFDNLMLFVIVGLSLFVLISSALVFNHPVFFWAGIFLLLIFITIAAIMSNTFWEFRTSEAISDVADRFPKIVFLMERLPFYLLFMGIATSVVMYISWRRQ